ncbi:MAG: 6-bladed beta-propeller [Candidatus Eremiobacterota bacterium]
MVESTPIVTIMPSSTANSSKLPKKSSPYIFVTKWGSKGDKDNEFNAPCYITIDSDGYIYVADLKKVCIDKFDSSGNFITKWVITRGKDKMVALSGLTVGGYNLIYVGEAYESQIYKFDYSGKLLTKWPAYKEAYDSITTDPEGNIFTVGGHFIYKFTSDGKFIKEWKINNIHGFNRDYHIGNIKIGSSGYIYLVQFVIAGDGHETGHCIQKYDSNMKLITQWSYNVGISIPFTSHIKIGIDVKENILVVNMRHSRIHMYDSSGKYIGKFGSTGSGDGQFNKPIDLVGDKEGNIYVSDYGNCRIQKFSPNPDFNKNN